MEFQYQLDKSSRKFICPACNKKSFVRFLDANKNTYCSAEFGRCDREIKCGYFLTPESEKDAYVMQKQPSPLPSTPYYVTDSDFNKTLSVNHPNNLRTFLNRLFGLKKTQDLFDLYKVGSSKKWHGATIFWQINHYGTVGQGKIMLFDSKTGKRVKKPFPHISSVHSLLEKIDSKPEYCFFGEHLLILNLNKPIAIVESEKTALIMCGIMPQYIWIASGGLSQLNATRLTPFKNNKIIFYPDLGAYEKWKGKADLLTKFGFKIQVSVLLEHKATQKDKCEGFDIADYFIKEKLKPSEHEEILAEMLNINPALGLLVDTFQLT